MYRTDVSQILHSVKNATFPAGPEALAATAVDAGAGGEVVAALQALPDTQYANRVQVAQSVVVDPSYDQHLTAAQRNEQARLGGRPGLSQHLRQVPPTPIQQELAR